MADASFIKHAIIIRDGKTCIDLDENTIGAALESNEFAWAHLDRNHPETRKWVDAKLAFLDPLIINALFDEETRPRVEEFGDGLLVNLRAANLHEGQEAHDMISFRLWIDDRQLVSVQRRKIFAVTDVLEKVRTGTGPKSAGRILASLILGLVHRMEPIITELGDKTDVLEEEVLENPDLAIRRRIVALRQQAIIFRRFMAPQREVAAKLRAMEKPWIDNRCRIAFLEAYDHYYRFIEELDSIRERLQVVQDELTNSLADKLNKRMYVLSIVTTIFLPLGFFTGLLGINVAGIWGAEYPHAFSVFIGMLMVIVVVMGLFFRWKKWL